MSATAGLRNGRVRVLIVDDEPALTDVLDGMLLDRHGLWVPRRLRYENPELPVLGDLVLTEETNLRRRIDKGRAPVIHTVRGLGHANRPVEDGR
ncbi:MULTISPECIES: hypothetical protein [unclassified Streptomyces]|uniref:hypothetical protein n=1 Tax=unclassified Streptomyces TaxID=2593676 RepID=UPI0023666DA9|nr:MULTISPECIES: hypothetical protein [unclassified Streptomyces]MDF3144303.1 hypothetical protein [Streptomyces sp. T21Q-yed]WDF42015.1 hypothetical protein PBV52_37075 [Streptomyces sp. T12]